MVRSCLAHTVHNHGFGRSKIHASRVRKKIPRFTARGLEERARVLLEDLRGQVTLGLKASVENPDGLGHRAARDQAKEEIRLGLAILQDGQPDSPVAERVRATRWPRGRSAQEDSLLSKLS